MLVECWHMSRVMNARCCCSLYRCVGLRLEHIVVCADSSWGAHQRSGGVHSRELCKNSPSPTVMQCVRYAVIDITKLCVVSRPQWQCKREWTSFRPIFHSSDSSSHRWPHISCAAMVSSVTLYIQSQNKLVNKHGDLRSNSIHICRAELCFNKLLTIWCVVRVSATVSLLWLLHQLVTVKGIVYPTCVCISTELGSDCSIKTERNNYQHF